MATVVLEQRRLRVYAEVQGRGTASLELQLLFQHCLGAIMSTVTISGDSVLIRALDVTTRVTDQIVETVGDSDGGALLETMLGRYVLDRDARAVWLLLDGRRSVSEVVDVIAAANALPVGELQQPVRDFCAQLMELRLAERTVRPLV